MGIMDENCQKTTQSILAKSVNSQQSTVNRDRGFSHTKAIAFICVLGKNLHNRTISPLSFSFIEGGIRSRNQG